LKYYAKSIIQLIYSVFKNKNSGKMTNFAYFAGKARSEGKICAEVLIWMYLSGWSGIWLMNYVVLFECLYYFC